MGYSVARFHTQVGQQRLVVVIVTDERSRALFGQNSGLCFDDGLDTMMVDEQDTQHESLT